MNAVPAALWKAASGNTGDVRCLLCAHRCLIPPDASGRCGVRINHNGSLFSVSSASVESVSLDPIEKKPLFHFLPGSRTLSFGAPGCTMRCDFCQNHGLSQAAPVPPLRFLPELPRALPERLVLTARGESAASIAYTYSEPTVFHELVEATARLAGENGIASVLVSNGYQSEACLERLRNLIHAANFDLKSFRDALYRELCGARLKPVLNTLRRAVSYGWWVEVTTLLISGRNDSREELQDIASFIAEELGPHVPWHVSRFRPAYRMRNHAPTPVASLERALETGKSAGLHFVYAGNVPGHPSESTRCPRCGADCIRRTGYASAPLHDGKCAACGTAIPGIWDISQLSFAARDAGIPSG